MRKKITYLDIENILGFEIDEKTKNKVSSYNLEYEELTKEKRDECILDILNVLTSDIKKSGKHRIKDWEDGWNENLEKFKTTKKIEDLIPKYHGKNKIIRWKGEFIQPITENFDYKIHICFVDAILNHYLKECENIFEFGCGPGYHLLRLNDSFNKGVNFFGLDWTKNSQLLIDEINKILKTDIKSLNFDFFNPNMEIEVPKNSGFYTVAALEQVGENFNHFIDFILLKKPTICVNIEPIDELLDDKKLIDNLSIKYFRKRNYLQNFLPVLEKLEKENKIKILKKIRTYSGSFFIEGHSLIVWKVL
jgi:hypothetical protein